MKTPICITELLDSTNNLDSLIDERIFRIIFKIKEYYIIYIQNKKSLEFNISKTVAKNILVYGAFDKENWEQETKKCGYRYLNQILENWKDEIQKE